MHARQELQAVAPSRLRRGSILIVAMVMVTMLAALTLSFAQRISGNEGRMEVDMAASYAIELAESANDWNVARIFGHYNQQNAVTDANTWLAGQVRSLETADPMTYDHIGGNGTFAERWVDEGAWMKWGPGEVKLSVKVLDANAANRYTLVEFKAWARFPDAITGRYIERQTKRVVRYSILASSKIYDFAYFANNYGWMYGSSITIHGAMGSNGNLGFKSGPYVNGDLFAAYNPAIGANGEVLSGSGFGLPYHQSFTSYKSAPRGLVAGDPMAMPPSPAYTEDTNNDGALSAAEDVNANGILDVQDYALGYDGNQALETGQNPLDMPYLGNLDYYKGLANGATRPARPDFADPGGTGGIIKQLKAPGLDPTVDSNYNYIVGGPGQDSIYGNDPGENGRYATWDGTSGTMTVDTAAIATPVDAGNQERNGNLALIGTADQPVIVSGPVVVTNDLVIKGVVKGQGTYYVGRNMHVVGDLTYADTPNWRDDSNANNATNLNNPNFEATKASNKDKDLVGYAVKGSILLGQYYRYRDNSDSWGTAKNYFTTGFQDNALQSYQVDPTDEAIGYVTGYDNGKPLFHGNYLANVVTPSGGLTGYNNSAANWDATAPNKAMKYIDTVFPDNYVKAVSTAGTAGTDTQKFVAPGNAANSAVSTAAIRPAVMMGIWYTNHLMGGRPGMTGKGITFYGTMVMRDEGIVFSGGSCKMVYDPRVANADPSSHVEIFIPQGTNFESVSWEEQSPGS